MKKLSPKDAAWLSLMVTAAAIPLLSLTVLAGVYDTFNPGDNAMRQTWANPELLMASSALGVVSALGAQAVASRVLRVALKRQKERPSRNELGRSRTRPLQD
jgi:hypothetical protein